MACDDGGGGGTSRSTARVGSSGGKEGVFCMARSECTASRIWSFAARGGFARLGHGWGEEATAFVLAGAALSDVFWRAAGGGLSARSASAGPAAAVQWLQRMSGRGAHRNGGGLRDGVAMSGERRRMRPRRSDFCLPAARSYTSGPRRRCRPCRGLRFCIRSDTRRRDGGVERWAAMRAGLGPEALMRLRAGRQRVVTRLVP